MNRSILLIIATLLISGSIALAEQLCWEPWKGLPSPSTECVRELKEACERTGGRWGGVEIGRGRSPGCNNRTHDGGKPCQDSSQCESACVSSNRSIENGSCYEFAQFRGCGKIIKTENELSVVCED